MPIEELCTKEVATIDGILETLRAMSEKGVRRAPIVDHAGRLAGIVAVDDFAT